MIILAHPARALNLACAALSLGARHFRVNFQHVVGSVEL